jgi:hypothetical protein
LALPFAIIRHHPASVPDIPVMPQNDYDDDLQLNLSLTFRIHQLFRQYNHLACTC